MKPIRRPYDAERVRAVSRQWQLMPDDQRVADQAIGRYVVGCGATHGLHEGCDFGCTACYLSKSANRVEPLPLDQVKTQLEELRAHLGPGGNVQITSGEVTLLPQDHLIQILELARDQQLSPMVMTHGDRLLHEPDYLAALVRVGGLSKISFHIDSTQRGRRGFTSPTKESDLTEVRARVAGLLAQTQKVTGRKLKAASTMTINQDNLAELPDVLRWFLSHSQWFRILSLQPQADVGRTHAGSRGTSMTDVWEMVEQAMERPLEPHAFRFGHPDCTRIAIFLVVRQGRGWFAIEAARNGNPEDRAIIDQMLADFAGTALNDQPLGRIVLSLMAVIMRKPAWIWRLIGYTCKRAWHERGMILRILAGMRRGIPRMSFFAVVVHAFMDSSQLQTELGQDRLRACAFKVPYQGEMISMCAFNALGLREQSYQKTGSRGL